MHLAFQILPGHAPRRRHFWGSFARQQLLSRSRWARANACRTRWRLTSTDSVSPDAAAAVDGTSDRDVHFMRRCLELAQRARPSPNPPVGCVIVEPDTARVLGEGYHERAGMPHAEVNALRACSGCSDAGRLADRLLHTEWGRAHGWTVPLGAARGAHVYVSLEPCNHHGRTPPCAEALIQAQVARVVIGVLDPDPRTAGGGAERLRRAGIAVQVGVLAAECATLYEGFTHRVRYQSPFGIYKYAMTLDGKIATATGDARWVSGSASRRLVHALRDRCDAVVVGGNTVRRDDPELTVRDLPAGVTRVNAPQPLRVVLTRQLARLVRDAPDAKLWDTARARTVVMTAHERETEADEAARYLRLRGVEVVSFAPTTSIVPQALEWLYHVGCCMVLWECGGALAAEALRHGALHQFLVFVAGKIVGGAGAPTPISTDWQVSSMRDAWPLDIRRVQRIEPEHDVLITAYPEGPTATAAAGAL